MFGRLLRKAAPSAEGLFVRHHPNGVKLEEGRYASGKRDGTWTRWYDNANLEDLARTAARLDRWEFLLTVAPLRLHNVTGSPVNPIAVF